MRTGPAGPPAADLPSRDRSDQPLVIAPRSPEEPPQPLSCALFAEPRLLRDLVAHWLSVRCRVQLVVRSGTAAEVCDAIDRHRPDLLIVGTSTDSAGPLEVIRHYVMVHPRGRVLALASFGQPFEPPPWLGDRLVASFDASTPLTEVGTAIDALAEPPEALDTGAVIVRTRGTPLSAQEGRILDLIAHGHTSRAIAASLGISEHTVRTHRKRIAAKLGPSGSRLVHRAVILRRDAATSGRGAEAG